VNQKEIDFIAGKYTRILKPKRADRNLVAGTLVTVDSEYRLPYFNPYTQEEIMEKTDGNGLPKEFLEPREFFLTFVVAYGTNVARWKIEKPPVTFNQFMVWILDTLEKWNVPIEDGKIIVCSHFLISELQHFEDIRKHVGLRKFGSGSYGEYGFMVDDWENYDPPDYLIEASTESGRIRLQFIDSYPLFGMSLEKLTDGTKYQKPKDDEIWHGKPWRERRANPHLLFKEDQESFWRYTEGDALGLWDRVDFWRRFVWEKWHIDILRVKTFSNIGLRIFQSKLKEPTEPYKEHLRPTKAKQPSKVIEFDHDKEDIRKWFLRLYKAGYRVSFLRGLVQKPIYAYDIVKLYTSAAIVQPLPNAHTEFVKITDEDDLDQYEGALLVEFEFPENTQYPCLPVTFEQFPKMICPLKGEEVESVANVRLAKKLGAKIHILDSCVFKPTEEEIHHPLRKVLEEILALANEGKGTPQEKFMKNIANGVIGKMFQRNRLPVDKEKPWEEKKTEVTGSWSPILSSLILAKGQNILFQIMQLGTGVYTHTDSFFSTTPIDMNSETIRNLEKIGSGLELKAIYHSFWTPRSAVRYGVNTENGKIEVAKGGIQGTEHEEFGEIISQKIGRADTPRKLVFVGAKLATLAEKEEDQSKRPLGHEIIAITNTEFEYDDKLHLLNPNANLWTEVSETRPWKSIEELLETLELTSEKTGRTEKMIDGYKRVARTPTGGRPKIIDPGDLKHMREMLQKGLTKYGIAQLFRDKYGRSTIYRELANEENQSV